MPVTSTKMAAATSERRSRPWTARSIRLARANSTHTHQTMTAVGERNTCGPPVASARFLRPTGTVPICSGYPPASQRAAGAAWTEERRRSDEGRRRLKGGPEASESKGSPEARLKGSIEGGEQDPHQVGQV